MAQETPVLRVQVGTDPHNPAGNPAQPDYQFVKLRFDAGHNGGASEAQGRPVFDRVLVLTHIYPGTTDSLDVEIKRYPEDGPALVVDPARCARFAEIVAKFEKDGEALQDGTPLAVINLDPAQIANLSGLGVQTVEALCDVPDAVLGRVGMGARALRERARAFRDAAAGNAPVAALSAKNDELEAQLAHMRETVEEMRKSMAAASAAAGDKPHGRAK